MTDQSAYTFPNCLHMLAAGLHIEGIDPRSVTISLPREKLWDLQSALERHFRGLMIYDGLTDEFRYMGFTFKPDGAENGQARQGAESDARIQGGDAA